MNGSSLQTWKNDINKLSVSISTILEEGQYYNEMIKAIDSNSDGDRKRFLTNSFISFIRQSYLRNTLITLRKLCETKNKKKDYTKTISLTNLLKSIKDNVEKLPESNLITIIQIQDNIDTLNNIAKNIKGVVDQILVHHDRIPPENYPSDEDLNKFIGTVNSLIKKYYLLINDRSLTDSTFLPFEEIFDIPWRKQSEFYWL